jgi:O-antigen/teichoic acid export membrane protein
MTRRDSSVPGARSFLADAFVLGGSAGLGQLLMLGAAPLLSRLYSPHEVGSYGLFLGLLMLSATAANLKYELAIPGVDENRTALALTVAAMAVCVPVAVVVAAMATLAAKSGALGLGDEDAAIMALIGPALLVTAAFTALRYWHLRQQRFALVARAVLAQSSGRALVPLVAGGAGLGWSGLVVGELAGRTLGLWGLACAARVDAAALGGTPSRSEIVAAARNQSRYPALVLPASMLDALAAFLPLPLFMAAFGPVAGGQLALVQRLLAVPAALIATSVGDVLHAHAGAAARGDRVLAAGVLRNLVLAAAIVYVPVIVLAPSLFAPVFGAEWVDSGRYAALLAPMVAAWTVASPLTRVFLVRDRLRLKLALDVANLVLPVGALWIASAAGPAAALGAYSAAGLCVAAAVVVAALSAARVRVAP